MFLIKSSILTDLSWYCKPCKSCDSNVTVMWKCVLHFLLCNILPPCGQSKHHTTTWIQHMSINKNGTQTKLQFSCTSLIYQFFIFTTNTLSSFSLWYSLKYFYTQPLFLRSLPIKTSFNLRLSLFWTFYNLLHL